MNWGCLNTPFWENYHTYFDKITIMHLFEQKLFLLTDSLTHTLANDSSSSIIFDCIAIGQVSSVTVKSDRSRVTGKE